MQKIIMIFVISLFLSPTGMCVKSVVEVKIRCIAMKRWKKIYSIYMINYPLSYNPLESLKMVENFWQAKLAEMENRSPFYLLGLIMVESG